MRKIFFGILSVVLFVSAGLLGKYFYDKSNKKNIDKESILNYSDSGRIFSPSLPIDAKNPDDPVAITTDYFFDFKLKMPEGFYFDTINVRNSIHKMNYKLYCLQSSLSGMEKFNTAIRKELLANVNEDIHETTIFYDTIPVDPIYTYELGPFEFFMNDKLISLCCLIDTYGFQGNHHNYTWYTFNYDLQNNKIIKFSDVFKISSSRDSSAFVSLVLRQMNDVYRTDWYDPFHEMDFSFVGKGICINPQLWWASSMQRAFLPSDSLKKFLNHNNLISKK